MNSVNVAIETALNNIRLARDTFILRVASSPPACAHIVFIILLIRDDSARQLCEEQMVVFCRGKIQNDVSISWVMVKMIIHILAWPEICSMEMSHCQRVEEMASMEGIYICP